MKIHLRANKGITRAFFARCAAKPVSGGKVRFNSRSNYRGIPQSAMVDPSDFRAAHNKNPLSTCSHCADMGLQAINRKRRQEGRTAKSSFFSED